MADVTISSLPKGTPSNSALLPYSQAGQTLSVAPSALLQNTGNIGIGTTTPQTILHVNGVVTASSFIQTQFLKAILSDVKPSGTGGGDIANNVWTRRVLNTKLDPSNIVSLNGDQFTLNPGKYYLNASAPAYRVHDHTIRLYRFTPNPGVQEYGTSEFNNYSAGYAQTRSFLTCMLDLTQSTTFQIEHYCDFSSGASSTLGRASLVASESPSIFTIVEITKIG